MGAIDLEYGAEAGIERLLRSVDRAGDFCVHGRLVAPMPRLEVEGVGMLAFPVPEPQLRALIGVAGRAPYGKGPETLIDTSVRDCRQIGPERIRLAGEGWPETFAEILDRVAAGLGCPGDRLEARLYKLLIYERGGFFAAHRDTEKAPGMIATLTVSLPVAGEGGELIVRHRGREVAVDMNVEEPSGFAFAAFYADCRHEIRPITAGHRLALVFNLCLRAADWATPREPPDYGEQVDAIAERLAAWQCEGGAAEKIVWLLDHAYSEAGLSFETLKNGDAARARVLSAAADRAGCELHAAIVHIEEHGDAMYGEEYRHGWYRNEADAEDMEIGELFDSRHWLDGWAGLSGARPRFGEIELNPGKLLPQGALDDAAPDEQWLHEATGNEGVSLERAFHHAALVLWPRSRTLAILAGAGIGGAVAWVAELLDRKGGRADADIERLASELVGIWPAGRSGRDEESRARMLALLTEVGDGECLSRFLREVILPDYSGGENESLVAAIDAVGPEAAEGFLLALVDAQFGRRPADVLALLRRLADGRDGTEGGARSEMLRGTLRSVLRAVSAAPAERVETPPDQWSSGKDEPMASWAPEAMADTADAEPVRPWRLSEEAVRDLFSLAWRWRLTDEGVAMAAVAAVPLLTTPDRALPAALRDLHGEPGFADSAAYAALWRHAARALLERSATPPEEPRHWKIACAIDCDCELCAELRAFCEDSAERVARFPLRKELRAHLHRIIDRHGLEMDHETERRGRPFTLVCTKNRASHRRRLAEYSVDIGWMRRLASAAPGGAGEAGCAPETARLREALAQSTPG
ncbi:MAG: 2OG-Fe(II) oxygenase [Defluviicoccus sp.]|nr:2OG-Fe(II) oxygenase [Defluviicoccus sp.]MDE0384069.1 2OG-Fe(II) oxygenase [Defluviicoccus sp.]